MAQQQLKRELGMFGAIVTGLGSILGTGAFVAIALASERWADAVLWAVPLAACVAVFNGLSSAFLAGLFPVAGGTYEYGYQALNPWLGFTAGWLFLLAKTASAATAALGVALYLGTDSFLVPLGAVALITVLVIAGLRRTTVVNSILITITISAILWFALQAATGGLGDVVNFAEPTTTGGGVLAATAFLFVAYTGYGRIATLGEEVKDPARTIPRAVVVTLAVAASLYMAIELGGRAWAGPNWGGVFNLSRFIDWGFVRFGAITAMLGVLLNLVLGLSRVWLAMGRRGDMPSPLARLDKRSEPTIAVIVTTVFIAGLTLVGDIALAWSFSAMTVLLYYGITNLAALAIDRRRPTAWLGLGSCLFLSFFVPPIVWAVGAGMVVLGLLWKTGFRELRSVPSQTL
ncbi:MAG TPA: APC family permease [Acidimicrobiia bacterium]|nr:APC family permease [Acidimicrobiia bacterium]